VETLFVQFQNISKTTPWMVIGNSEGVGEGVSKAIFLKEKYEANTGFPGGGGLGSFKLKKPSVVEVYGYTLLIVKTNVWSDVTSYVKLRSQ